MNAQEYMEKALLLEKNFTPENKAYFEKLRNYLAAASFFYDEKEVKSQIYQLAVDFQVAQDHGETAEEYFGDNPKEMANQLIKGFKKQSKARMVKFSGGMILISWLSTLITTFQSLDDLSINLWYYLLEAVGVMVFIRLFFFVLQQSIYDTKSPLLNKIKSNRILSTVIFAIMFMVICGSVGSALYLLPKNAILTLTPPIDLILITGISLLITLGIFFKRIPITYPFLLLLWGWVIPGILRRIPQFHSYFIGDAGTMLFIIIFGVSTLGFALIFSRIAKKELKKYHIEV